MSTSTRKPHNDLVGYVCELKAALGGHVVIYDTKLGFDDGYTQNPQDREYRFIVCIEPGGTMVPEHNIRMARNTMKALAACRTAAEANAYFDGAYPNADYALA